MKGWQAPRDALNLLDCRSLPEIRSTHLYQHIGSLLEASFQKPRFLPSAYKMASSMISYGIELFPAVVQCVQNSLWNNFEAREWIFSNFWNSRCSVHQFPTSSAIVVNGKKLKGRWSKILGEPMVLRSSLVSLQLATTLIRVVLLNKPQVFAYCSILPASI